MIKVLKISTFIFVLMILCAPSCEDEQEIANREDAILEAAANNIRDEFETNYLNEASLFAYEIAAKQKLSDLSDYLQIMTDTTLDMSFRKKAGEMIKSTFQSENDKLDLIELNEGPVKEYKVSRIINMGLDGKLPHVNFAVEFIQVYKHLNRTDNNTYSGILRFVQNYTDQAVPKQITNSIKREADFYVVKKDKVFGTDSLKIWTVQLGNIR